MVVDLLRSMPITYGRTASQQLVCSAMPVETCGTRFSLCEIALLPVHNALAGYNARLQHYHVLQV